MTTTNKTAVTYPETITAGRVTLTRNQYGTITYLDARGHRQRVDGPEINRLVDATRDGSGEEQKRTITEGTAPPTNVIYR